MNEFMNKFSKTAASLVLFVLCAMPAQAAERQILRGHVPRPVSDLKLPAIGRLPGTNQMRLVMGLPLHHRDALSNLLQQIYDPASASFHRYLDPARFTQQFGPTEQDYQQVLNFAKSNGLAIHKTYGDRVLLEVTASVSTIESAFHVTLQTYQHPTEARQFFAPDVEPLVDAGLPLLFISGLNNFSTPRPLGHVNGAPAQGGALGGVGSAPDGNSFIGNDFRNAYVPSTPDLFGGGQIVGLMEFNGYFASDISNYLSTAGYSTVTLQNVALEGFTGPQTSTQQELDGVAECSADIELAIAMAPFLDKVVIFEGVTNTDQDPLLSAMVSSNQILQLSCSWEWGTFDPVAEDYLIQMAGQGQTFIVASGDGGAYLPQFLVWPGDDPFATSVGGTELTMVPHGASYVSESVWQFSTGGVSATFPLPPWQLNAQASLVGGSVTMRNFPDVTMVADDIWINYDHTTATFTGTSCGAPLWAGVTALVNEFCAAESKPPIGFLNPGLYAIGEGANYSASLNDIKNGNNTWSNSPTLYYAAPGYDLCSGWGSPKTDLIGYLSGYAGAANVIYVDFNYTGATQNGKYATPFKTLTAGANAVATNGTVIIKTAGSSSETPTISKPMFINAIGGAATIGN